MLELAVVSQSACPLPLNRAEILNDAADCAMLEDKPWISGS
jgi:hypothetical protein